MAESHRLVRRDQPFLLPPDMREWLPADHVVWFLLETVEALDTSTFHSRRRLGGVGAAGYDPDMLLALLIYAYCQGVRSSRQIERRCLTDVAFRVLCAQDIPDHATIARFTRVLLVAAEAGLARLGTVAIDGTKIPANASLDANRGEEWLQAQVRQLVAEARQVDAAEQVASTTAGSSDDGDDGDGDKLPARLRDRSHRTEMQCSGADGGVRLRRVDDHSAGHGHLADREVHGVRLLVCRRLWTVSDRLLLP